MREDLVEMVYRVVIIWNLLDGYLQLPEHADQHPTNLSFCSSHS